MSRPRNNIRKFKRRPDVNIGLVIFIVIFIYICVSVIIYAVSKKTTIYEVNAGTLAYDDVYTGFILRDEAIVKSDYSGNVNYYVRGNQKTAVGNVVYSVDETGRVSELINSSVSQSLSDEDMITIKEYLSELSINYNNMDYEQVYGIKESISNSIYEFQTGKITDNLDQFIKDTNDNEFFHQVEAAESGIISYFVDGYESYDESMITSDLFDNSKYSSTNLSSAQLINKGDSAYKLISSDKWNIYIQLDETAAAALNDTTSIKIGFVDTDIDCTADFTIINNGTGKYGKITLDKYMINFSDERYVQVEISSSNKSGLKIPVTAVCNQSFYTIPKECLAANGSFIRKYYSEDGQVMTEAINADIYDEDDKYYYVSMNDFSSGDILMIADSDNTFVVGTIGELTGVFCVNKGYAVFKKVDVIDKNSEYYIVKKGSNYGLAIYDHIVLDYKSVKENEIVN